MLPQGFENIVRASTTKGTIRYADTEYQVSMNTGDPCVYMVERLDFDAFLLDKAIAAGARFVGGNKVTGVWQDTKGVEVYTKSSEVFKARYVIAADGGMSRIRSQVLPSKWLFRGYCLEARVPWEGKDDGIILNFGGMKTGYTWIFPKKDYASVGLGVFRWYVKDAMESYRQFLKRYDIEWVKPKGLPLFIYLMDAKVTYQRILFAGDAAHLVDPITGEGIHNAILSGSMAAQAIMTEKPAENYQSMMNNSILPELRKAFSIGVMLYLFPRMSFKALMAHPHIADVYLEVLAGKKKYNDLLRVGAQGPYKLLKVALSGPMKKSF